MTKPAHAVVIGAGSTDSALAHDLSLRRLRVMVLDRAGLASGATGHNQAQLHSGARYAVNDPEAARECIQENWILRGILLACSSPGRASNRSKESPDEAPI